MFQESHFENLAINQGSIMQEENTSATTEPQDNNASAQAEVQTATESATETQTARIAELEAALEEAKAQVLYIKADSENIRRRSYEDIEKARKFALEKFSGELLAVKDSLDAALAVESADVASYKNGVELTAKQLLSVFEKFNIAEINPVGEKFDPNKHQAISMVPAEGEPNTVLTVLQKGYTLNERVLRPALVTVIQPK